MVSLLRAVGRCIPPQAKLLNAIVSLRQAQRSIEYRGSSRVGSNPMADYRSDIDRASEHFLNYMTSCALGETSVGSEEGGGCESAAVHHRLASLHLDGGGDAGE